MMIARRPKKIVTIILSELWSTSVTTAPVMLLPNNNPMRNNINPPIIKLIIDLSSFFFMVLKV